MIARRTEKHLAQTAQARVERWRRIAREAAKQSRRSDVPVVGEVVTLKSAVQMKPEAGLSLLLAEQERGTSLYSAVQHFEENGDSLRGGTGRWMDRGRRNAVRERRVAAGEFGSKDFACGDCGDCCDGCDCGYVGVKQARFRIFSDMGVRDEARTLQNETRTFVPKTHLFSTFGWASWRGLLFQTWAYGMKLVPFKTKPEPSFRKPHSSQQKA